MKTKVAILAEIHRHKTCSRAQLDRYLTAFHITPLGVRQRPRLYPDDAAERILKQLGLMVDAGLEPERPRGAPVRLMTMKQLREERRKGARRAA